MGVLKDNSEWASVSDTSMVKGPVTSNNTPSSTQQPVSREMEEFATSVRNMVAQLKGQGKQSAIVELKGRLASKGKDLIGIMKGGTGVDERKGQIVMALKGKGKGPEEIQAVLPRLLADERICGLLLGSVVGTHSSQVVPNSNTSSSPPHNSAVANNLLTTNSKVGYLLPSAAAPDGGSSSHIQGLPHVKKQEKGTPLGGIGNKIAGVSFALGQPSGQQPSPLTSSTNWAAQNPSFQNPYAENFHASPETGGKKLGNATTNPLPGPPGIVAPLAQQGAGSLNPSHTLNFSSGGGGKVSNSFPPPANGNNNKAILSSVFNIDDEKTPTSGSQTSIALRFGAPEGVTREFGETTFGDNKSLTYQHQVHNSSVHNSSSVPLQSGENNSLGGTLNVGRKKRKIQWNNLGFMRAVIGVGINAKDVSWRREWEKICMANNMGTVFL